MSFLQSLTDNDWCLEELYAAWRAASAEADNAYAAWSLQPDGDRYAAYVAATERADAAVDHLATEYARHTRNGTGRRAHAVRSESRCLD